ncbi:hypothetical protein [Xanthomonas arboricola]|uniref:hypothetical protein n=1 Tax=Xanthomonas arboricola TaxID=56448 RepID=UPI001364A9FB|nr:hypothetical protein [Xanthomonas arboricola]
MGALPFGWENTLVGFQSQFYINSLLAFTAIAVVSFGGIGYRTGVLLSLLILGSFASMANGVLTAFACAGLLMCRGVFQPSLFRRGLALAVFATFLGIAGFIATPSPSHHAALKAQDFSEFIHALWITSSWPLPPWTWSAGITDTSSILDDNNRTRSSEFRRLFFSLASMLLAC